jgi:hypothetical protein
MGMLDDLEKMMILQQMEGQQQGQGYDPFSQQAQMQPQMQNINQTSPLEKGSMMAVQSARDSIAAKKRMLAMDDNESQRALGRAILAMRDSMNNNPNYGTGTMANIAALAGGAADGMMQYDQERERIANANNFLLSQQREEERLARQEELQMKKMAHAMEMDKKRLGIEQGYYGLKKQEREDELNQHKRMSEYGAKIPLSSMGENRFNHAQKEIKEYLEQGESARNVLDSIKGAKQILKEDPGITKNMATIMLAAQRHDPTIVRQKLNSVFIPEETRIRAEMLTKYLSNIYTSKLKGMPARGMNMFLEKQLKEGNVDINLDAKSIIGLLDEDERNAEHKYKNGLEVYDEYEKGNFYRPKPLKLREEEEKESGPAIKSNDVEEFRALLKALQEAKE